MTKTYDPIAEYHRQCAILARQESQYQTAKPTARFAYAAHITKTKQKISRLESEVPVAEIYVNLGYRDALDGTDVTEFIGSTFEHYRTAYERGFARGQAERSAA